MFFGLFSCVRGEAYGKVECRIVVVGRLMLLLFTIRSRQVSLREAKDCGPDDRTGYSQGSKEDTDEKVASGQCIRTAGVGRNYGNTLVYAKSSVS